MTNVNDQIQEIIKKRSAIMEKIGPEQKKWDGYSVLANKLKADVGELRRSLIGAISTINNVKDAQKEDGVKGELNSLLEKVDSLFSGGISQLQDKCKRAKDKLKKLEERCNRKTINIAVAGESRSGKSTALKSILGLNQGDNSIIPTSKSPAVTAGKSTIACVKTEEEQKTVVKFHTRESFLEKLINPFMDSIYQGTKKCYSVEEFLKLDLQSMHDELSHFSPEMNLGIDPRNIVHIETRKSHLSCLSEIQKNTPELINYLNGSEITIPSSETCKYVSYQRDEKGNYCGLQLCYAVQEVTIYYRFPNNEIESLRLIDLPGLGTCNEHERKCFLEGFNYSVDLALIIRRPRDNNMNYPSDPDRAVNIILSDTFGPNSWDNCAFMFLNTGEIDDATVGIAKNSIDTWKAKEGHDLTVLCGDAFDPNYMQKELLPSVLSYMTEKLPRFDENLFNTLQNDLETLEEEFKQKCSELLASISEYKKVVKLPNKDYETKKLVETFQKNILKEVDAFINDRSYQSDIIDKVFNAIDAKTEEIRQYFRNRYSSENNEQIDAFILEKQDYEDLASGFVTREIQRFRIVISERYSDLENYHQEIIQSLQDFIYKIVQKATGKLLPEEGNIDFIIKRLEDVDNGDSEPLIQAFKNIKYLEAPFYTILYPDLRVDVFHTDNKDTITNLTEPAKALKTKDNRETIINCMGYLNEIANEWVNYAQELLRGHIVIDGIVQAAAERFEDNIVRSAAVEPGLYAFLSEYKAQIINNEDSWKQAINEKLNRIIDLLKELTATT